MKQPTILYFKAYDFKTIEKGDILFCINGLLNPFVMLVTEYLEGFNYFLNPFSLSASLIT